jgi:hypothetical protein
MQTLVAEILAAWRRADRLTHEHTAGTLEHAAAMEASDRLREVYRDLTHSGAAREVSEAEAKELLRRLDDREPLG